MTENQLKGFIAELYAQSYSEKEACLFLEAYNEKQAGWLGRLGGRLGGMFKFKPGLSTGKNLLRVGRNAGLAAGTAGGLGTAAVLGAPKLWDSYKNSDLPGSEMATRMGGSEGTPDVSTSQGIRMVEEAPKPYRFEDINPYARSWGGDAAVFGQYDETYGGSPPKLRAEWDGAEAFNKAKRRFDTLSSDTNARIKELQSSGASKADIEAERRYLKQLTDAWNVDRSAAQRQHAEALKSFDAESARNEAYINRWNRVNKTDTDWNTNPSDGFFSRLGRSTVEGLGLRRGEEDLSQQRQRVNEALARQLQMNKNRAALLNSRPQ